MNFIKVISIFLLPIMAFSYSYYYFANDMMQSSNVSINLPIQENVLTKLATTVFLKMSVNATVSSIFIVNKTGTLVLDLSFSNSEKYSPLREFEIFYSLVNTIFYDFPSINYIEFINPVFIKYVSTDDIITRDEVKYEDK